MPLFLKSKKIGVQSFILRLVNSHCPELQALAEGPRLEGRANLMVVVMVIPVENGKPLPQQAFTALTKEFSTTGVAIVLDDPLGLDQVILGFRGESEMVFVRATARHLNPMGGGFYQLGLQMSEVIHVSDYPELRSIVIEGG